MSDILNQAENDQEVFNHIADPVFIHDQDYRLVLVNDAYCRAAGVSGSDVLGKFYWEVFPPGDGPLPECMRLANKQSHKPGHDEVAVGNKRYISNSYVYRQDTKASPWYVHILAEITGSTMVDIERHEANKLLQTIINNVPVRIFWKGRDLRYLGANALFAHDAGFSNADELIGKTDLELAWGPQAEAYRTDDLDVMNAGEPKLDYDEPQTTPNGDTIWVRTSKVPMHDDNGDVTGLLGIYFDITDRKKHEDEMQHMAMIDPLTGLSNRQHFNLLASQCIKLAERQGHVLAMLMLDLDRFKPVNDTFGHQAGDSLLKIVASKIRNHTRQSDITCRLGGDEFVILLVGPNEDKNAGTIAQKLIEEISKPVNIQGHSIEVGVSIGISVFPSDADDTELLLKHADLALYETKRKGRGSYTYYRQELAHR